METAATVVVHVLLLTAVIAAQWRRTPLGRSIDGERYADMVLGDRTPKPYCYRVLVPWMARGVMRLSPLDHVDSLYVTTQAGSVACVAACYLLTLTLGGSLWAAFVAALTLVMTQSLFGSWLMFPLLVDSWAMAFGAGAVIAAPFSAVAAACLLVLAAMSKEAALVLAWGFLTALTPSLWWVGVPGALVLVALYLRRTPAPAEHDHEAPLHAIKTKREQWLSYKHNLAGLGATPWLAAYFLPDTALAVPALVVVLLAVLQTTVGNDHARLVSASTPFLIPALCAVAPVPVLGAYALLQTFWPFGYPEEGWF